MRSILPLFILLGVMLFVRSSALAQTQSSSQPNHQDGMSDMPGMPMPRQTGSNDTKKLRDQALSAQVQEHASSGTSLEPYSTPTAMLMTSVGNWMLMVHGEAFLNEIQQSGPRGSDKLFSTNWIMPMAQRKFARGTLTLRTMLSFEPATITGRFYPELFQLGETAYGKPIIDGQHPHDFPMEIAILYDYRVGKHTTLSFYAAPVGDPAMGPVAYPHRTSASENPVAALGHHLEDSTHISDDVITAGLAYRNIRLEASGFHGREPDEFRWNVDSGKVDSWSTRLTINPSSNWSGQFSIAQLHSPEALFPAETVRRMTASVMYNRPFKNGNWASTLLWGRNRSLVDGNIGNAYLAESTLRFTRNSIWTRIENVDRTNELLLSTRLIPPGFNEKYFARIHAYTVGYDREIGNVRHLSLALGGQLMWYGAPRVFRPLYGPHPTGEIVFLRIRAR